MVQDGVLVSHWIRIKWCLSVRPEESELAKRTAMCNFCEYPSRDALGLSCPWCTKRGRSRSYGPHARDLPNLVRHS